MIQGLSPDKTLYTCFLQIRCAQGEAVSALSEASSIAVEPWAEWRDEPEPGRELGALERDLGVLASREDGRDFGDSALEEEPDLGVAGFDGGLGLPASDFWDLAEAGLDGSCLSALGGFSGTSSTGGSAFGCCAITGSDSP